MRKETTTFILTIIMTILLFVTLGFIVYREATVDERVDNIVSGYFEEQKTQTALDNFHRKYEVETALENYFEEQDFIITE